jgi:hypothetical protein
MATNSDIKYHLSYQIFVDNYVALLLGGEFSNFYGEGKTPEDAVNHLVFRVKMQRRLNTKIHKVVEVTVSTLPANFVVDIPFNTYGLESGIYTVDDLLTVIKNCELKPMYIHAIGDVLEKVCSKTYLSAYTCSKL